MSSFSFCGNNLSRCSWKFILTYEQFNCELISVETLLPFLLLKLYFYKWIIKCIKFLWGHNIFKFLGLFTWISEKCQNSYILCFLFLTFHFEIILDVSKSYKNRTKNSSRFLKCLFHHCCFIIFSINIYIFLSHLKVSCRHDVPFTLNTLMHSS